MKKRRELRPVRVDPRLIDRIEAEVLRILRKEIYAPLLRELNETSVVQNAKGGLRQAVASGQIQYVDGHFEGAFDASISREIKSMGGVWDRTHGWWRVPRSALGADLRSAIGQSVSHFQAMAKRVDKALEKVLPEAVAGKMKLESLFDKTLFIADKQFRENVSSLTVAPVLTKEQRGRIAAEYTENMQLYIQEFADKEITKLRESVKSETFAGLRREGMVKAIRDSYGVSEGKAKFLARQESKLLVTKFAQTRYQAAGVNKYRWQCVVGSPAHPVRPMHKELNGKIFSWDNPPVVDEKGNRKNPGQDYNCRCTSIPVVEF